VRWFQKITIIGIIITILTYILIWLKIDLVFIFVSSSLATLILGAMSFYKREEKEKILDLFFQLQNAFEHEKKKHSKDTERHISEIKRIKQEINSEKTKRQRLSKMFSNIGVTLTKENISKEEIIKNISRPLKAILFQKYWEDPGKKRFILRDEVFPKIHAYHIKGGLYIIPPAFVPQYTSNDECVKWFRNQLKENIPSDYQYNIPFASTVNLTDIKSFKNLNKEYDRGHFNWLRNVPTEDIAPTEMLVNYLVTKKDISTRDIIEIPNIMFLVDDNQITIKDKLILNKNRNKIIDDIKNYLQINELKTTELANMGEQELTFILADNGVNRPLNVSRMLITNAKLWKVVLDRQLNGND
jgi:hypothetical protein